MKYYLISFSHNVCFKTAIMGGDVASAVSRWMRDQNSGEAKSDRLILNAIEEVDADTYHKSIWWERNYLNKYL